MPLTDIKTWHFLKLHSLALPLVATRYLPMPVGDWAVDHGEQGQRASVNEETHGLN